MGMMDRVVEWNRLERRPAPLNMSDTEVLDWMNEYCTQAVYTRPTAQVCGGFTVYSDDIKVTKATLRDAVCAAAAQMAEENGVKFMKTFCSHCGGEFGPGNHGFSRCEDHKTLRRKS